jgi:hypothetical protein
MISEHKTSNSVKLVQTGWSSRPILNTGFQNRARLGRNTKSGFFAYLSDEVASGLPVDSHQAGIDQRHRMWTDTPGLLDGGLLFCGLITICHQWMVEHQGSCPSASEQSAAQVLIGRYYCSAIACFLPFATPIVSTRIDPRITTKDTKSAKMEFRDLSNCVPLPADASERF